MTPTSGLVLAADLDLLSLSRIDCDAPRALPHVMAVKSRWKLNSHCFSHALAPDVQVRVILTIRRPTIVPADEGARVILSSSVNIDAASGHVHHQDIGIRPVCTLREVVGGERRQ